jgi:hypothetical protein
VRLDDEKLQKCVDAAERLSRRFDAFEENKHPRDPAGKFSVTTEKVPHPSGAVHKISTKSGYKETLSQKHNVFANSEHVGHVQTHVENVQARSVGRMRPTGEERVRWSYEHKSGEGNRYGLGSKKEAIKHLIGTKFGYKIANEF